MLAYSLGLICVCTVLLFIGTIFSIQTYLMLRKMVDVTPSAHDERPPERSARRARTERFDSAVPERESGGEWTTGPVVPYTPPDRTT